jgi:hypothetical protein
MVLADFKTGSVDTPEDLRSVDEMMKNDPLVARYAKAGG